MPWNDNDSPAPQRSAQELLELVRSKSEAMRRRRAWSGATAAVALLLALPVLATMARNAPETSVSVLGPATTSTTDVPTTTTDDGPATTWSGADALTTTTSEDPSLPTTSSSLAARTDARPRPSTAGNPAPKTATGEALRSGPSGGEALAPTSTSTTMVCRNSRDPACGQFYWDPLPEPDQALTVQVTFSPAAPRAGQTVIFHVVAEDPDAAVLEKFGQARDWGDGTGDVTPSTHGDCFALYGPWTPPPRNGSRHEATFEHVYDKPGTYTAVFSFESQSFCAGYDPYGSRGQAAVTLTVGR